MGIFAKRSTHIYLELAKGEPRDGKLYKNGKKPDIIAAYFHRSNNRPEMDTDWLGSKTVCRKKMPAFYHFKMKKDSRYLLGHINYEIIQGEDGRKIAVTKDYYPKNCTEYARGLGYYLEAVATSQLEKHYDITFISTSQRPNEPRRKQLEPVNLPINTPVPIRKWLLGLGKGIQFIKNEPQPKRQQGILERLMGHLFQRNG